MLTKCPSQCPTIPRLSKDFVGKIIPPPLQASPSFKGRSPNHLEDPSPQPIYWPTISISTIQSCKDYVLPPSCTNHLDYKRVREESIRKLLKRFGNIGEKEFCERIIKYNLQRVKQSKTIPAEISFYREQSGRSPQVSLPNGLQYPLQSNSMETLKTPLFNQTIAAQTRVQGQDMWECCS